MHVLFEEGLVAPDLGGLADHVNGVDDVRGLADGFAPEAVAAHCGVPADEIRTLARELAAAPTAAVYGRIGTSTVEFGTLGSWLVDVLNVLTGNLDRPGGAMFPLAPAAPAPRPPDPASGFTTGRWHSRVSGYPEALSELPAAALAEEIDTPGDGQIKAMITIAGNPVLSAPDGDRLDRALDGVGLHGQRRPVPQRDHAARRRHPAAAAPVAEPALRLRAEQPRGAQQRPLLAAGACRWTAGLTRRRSCPGSR